MAEGPHDILLRAVARNADVVVSFPPTTGGGGTALKHHKSRFLSGAPTGFWVELPAGQAETVDALIAARQVVGVSFRNGDDTLRFTAPVRRQDSHRVSATSRVAGMMLGFPSQIRSTAADAEAARLAATAARRDPSLPGWIARMRGQ
jgi:hypothetical protein